MKFIYVLNILEDFGEKINKQFSQTIATDDLILALIIAAIASLIIDFIYKKTYIGVSYSKSNSLSIILLTLVTTVVIKAINSNLSLSLGMVGALSIVRFRTAIKDPVDTIFMFWSITVGILSGAGLYIVALLSTLIIAIVYFLCFIIQIKQTRKMLMIIVCKPDKAHEIIKILRMRKKCVIKTEMYKSDMAELTYEVSKRSEIEDILLMNNDEDVKSINVIDID